MKWIGIVNPTERQIQRGILEMAGTCFPDVVIHHSPNGAHLAGDGAARFKQMGALIGDGMKKGWPDLQCLWPVGQGCFIEVKRPKTGKMSADQIELHARIMALGWRVKTVTSVDEAYRFLVDCGAPCRANLQGMAA